MTTVSSRAGQSGIVLLPLRANIGISMALWRGHKMPWYKLLAIATLCASVPLFISCGHPESGTQNDRAGEKRHGENVLNFYNWADYIAPDTIASFEAQTGIKVHASYFESNETLESR